MTDLNDSIDMWYELGYIVLLRGKMFYSYTPEVVYEIEMYDRMNPGSTLKFKGHQSYVERVVWLQIANEGPWWLPT